MYKPLFNTVLVEISDQDAKWGSGTNENIGGEAYREGTLIEVGGILMTAEYPNSDDAIEEIDNRLKLFVGKTLIWNEGHEAGTVFEEAGKKYALLYWWDLRGVKG
jgi:hypothetical protein